jgi:hypothetical protein
LPKNLEKKFFIGIQKYLIKKANMAEKNAIIIGHMEPKIAEPVPGSMYADALELMIIKDAINNEIFFISYHL